MVSLIKLVKVRVVYASLFNHEGVPVKCHVARGTPHLRAPTNLEDHLTAPGTGFGVLLEKGDTLNTLRVAHVTLFYGFVAVLADIVLADLTLPSAREEPSTIRDGTLSDKLSLDLWRSMFNILAVKLETPNSSRYFYNFDPTIIDDSVNPFNISNLLNLLDGLGHEALFALEENVFSVLLVSTFPEGLGAGCIEDLPGPPPGTVHALGVAERIEEAGLNAFSTHVKITKRANGLFMIF